MLIHPLSLLDSRVLFSMCWERSRLPGILNVSLSCSVDLGGGRSSGSRWVLLLGRWSAYMLMCFCMLPCTGSTNCRCTKGGVKSFLWFCWRLDHLVVGLFVHLSDLWQKARTPLKNLGLLTEHVRHHSGHCTRCSVRACEQLSILDLPLNLMGIECCY